MTFHSLLHLSDLFKHLKGIFDLIHIKNIFYFILLYHFYLNIRNIFFLILFFLQTPQYLKVLDFLAIIL